MVTSINSVSVTPPPVDPVLTAYNNALAALYAQLQKVEGESYPDPVQMAKLVADIKNVNATFAKLDPKVTAENTAIQNFQAATGAAITGGLYQALTAAANSFSPSDPSALVDLIEDCQDPTNADSTYFSNLISQLSEILPTA